jgi:hypothetical protein
VQPLVVVIGVVMGSAVALFAGLTMVLAVFLLLPGFSERLAGEFQPLLQAIAWAALLVGASAAAFMGQLRVRPWRRYAQLALAGALLLIGWHYWP